MKALFGMSLEALGVVYGDIGTLPLYAVNEIFFGHAREAISRADVLGVISIIFWVITLIVTVKYVLIVLNADSEGEGGVFSLYSLIQGSNVKNNFTQIYCKFLTGVTPTLFILLIPIQILKQIEL